MGKSQGVPETTSTEELDLQGKDEMNLAEFPIAALTDYVPKGQNTISFNDGIGSLLVTGSDAYGLPTAADADVVIALILLTKRRNNFDTATVHFSRAEILDILGWPESGKAYRRLTESLYRWSTTSLHYEGTWWDQRSRRRMNAVFHILNEVVLFDRGEPSGSRSSAPQSYFTWNKIFLDSCQAGNLKRLDVRMYFALQHASSKRLYRFLDKRLHRQTDQTFDLAEIAFERVGLSRSYVGKKGGVNVSKVREKLQPAIDELEARGFLAPMDREERFKKQGPGWSIRFVRAGDPAALSPPASDEPVVPPVQAETPAPPEPSPEVDALVRRGVSRAKAEELAALHPAAQIAEKIELFDWKSAKDSARLRKNPAGWLVKAIEDGYPPPAGFESQADRQKRLEAEKDRAASASAEARRRRDEDRRRDRDRQATDAYLARLSPQERASLEAEALAAAPEDVRQSYETIGPTPMRKVLLSTIVRDHAARKLRPNPPMLF